MNNVRQTYQDRVANISKELAKVNSIFSFIYISRLATFVGFVAFLILFFNLDKPIFIIGSIALLLLFVVLVRVDSKYAAMQKYLKSKLDINGSELEIIRGSYSNRKKGEKYSSIDPFLTADFDLVGEGSMFQYLNRTSTLLGEQLFAQNLCKSEKNVKIISEKQSAVQELSKKIEFTQDFQVYGGCFDENIDELEYFRSWILHKEQAAKNMRAIAIFAPLFTLFFVVLAILGILSYSTLAIPVILNIGLVNLNMHHIQKSQARLNKSTKIVKKYSKLISLIEDEEFNSAYLTRLKSKLELKSQKASTKITALVNLLSLFDANYNLFVYIVCNGLFGFSAVVYYKLESWKNECSDGVEGWFSAIAEVDSLISYAVFAHNNSSSTTYPEILNEGFVIEATELGHPLVDIERRVNNDIAITKSPAIIIITGANMAGKSTFLRTIAVNLILAMNGAPVSAKRFRFTPSDIISSIKIKDALSKNESYFYAEISRLSDVVAHVNNNDRSVVILDEILRGTNTKDKQIGSLGLLKKLISPNAIVFIATHDLIIGKLEEEYPEIAKNYCFEVELVDDSLLFDYKLKNGVSQKLNASFLLRKMGLI